MGIRVSFSLPYGIGGYLGFQGRPWVEEGREEKEARARPKVDRRDSSCSCAGGELELPPLCGLGRG